MVEDGVQQLEVRDDVVLGGVERFDGDRRQSTRDADLIPHDTPGQAQRRTAAPGLYWLLAGLANDQRAMRRAPFPRAVPVVDVVAEHPPFASPRDVTDWHRAHRRFVAAAPNRRLVTATGSGHYVMRDRPQLLVRTIAQFYWRCLPRPK